ncbi:MAG: hypothetical protein CO012_06450 [Syntrophobacterales bacterium CG_4_8_14_3_um_filter_49_14]|nr:MAG: hypothetical protein COX52_00950 [Syntrophobacterales bacterium CG23_combo_of_CG06-09_8_20_14_all_48_27]PJA50492.1 MAG: hypothetical protein CO171_01435 [Syntrophobacterales bacterium CG_4_9_14_3_um_filter_49_8]PJC74364.1 MAG: hypothetical protein CO012_06450 [Syntrophobacterales bacterium CG_4_8_14_3_um_filter_49_14]
MKGYYSLCALPYASLARSHFALKLDPKNTFYRYWYCRWLGYTRNYENAIAECEKILQLDPGNKKAKEWLEECRKAQRSQ